MENLRRYFRLVYPPPLQPTFVLKANPIRFRVLDLAEVSMKFELTLGFELPLESVVEGTIHFRDGKSCQVAGEVYRLGENGSCVVLFSRGVPFAKIMEEQRHVLKRYPSGP